MTKERKAVLADLEAERMRLAIRLDRVDTAIALLREGADVVPIPRPEPRKVKRGKKRGPKKDRRRHPRRVLPLRVAAPAAKKLPAAEQPGAAAARREVVQEHIRKAGQAGLTLAQLRKVTEHMTSSDRGNALQGLKTAGKIRRVGTSWLACAPFDSEA